MEKFKDRYNIMAVCFLLVGVIFITQLANLQVIKGEYYDNEAQKRSLNERTITAARGNILDRNGILIANNRMGFIVQIQYAGIEGDELNDMLLRLVKVFEKNNDTYNKNISKYITFNPIAFGSAVKALKNPASRIVSDLNLKLKSGDKLVTAEDVFRFLRERKYKINSKYSDEDAYKIMKMRYEIRNFSSLNPTLLARDVSKFTVAELEEKHHDFPGVTTDVEPVRKYNDAQYVPHILGYIGAINDRELEKYKSQGYGMNDLIGKTGIELAAEEYLRGTDGQRRVEVNTEGHLTEELNSNPAIPGKNVVLTIDMNLQKIASESLEKTINGIKAKEERYDVKGNNGDAFAGAVVAMDVNNGDVLAMASYPSYDPSTFLENANNKAAQKQITTWLNDAINKPMTNRAIAEAFPPGSTFKPLVGVAGMEEGVIARDTKYNDPGMIEKEGQKLYCLEYRNHTKPSGHGFLDLKEALATSCNIFFYQLGMNMGSDKIDKWAKMFGLGEYSGIELSGETKGTRSNKEIHKKNSTNTWGYVLTAYSSIGQLYNNYTPIQLVNYAATIANGGKKFTPHLIKRVLSYDGTVFKDIKPQVNLLHIKKETIAAVKEGMEAVTDSNSEGTAASVFSDFYKNYGIKVAGKTGTAETNDSIYNGKSNNGMFICYAPADNPKIAIAVAVQRGVWGKFAADVARDIMAEYFNINNKNNTDVPIKPDQVFFTR